MNIIDSRLAGSLYLDLPILTALTIGSAFGISELTIQILKKAQRLPSEENAQKISTAIVACALPCSILNLISLYPYGNFSNAPLRMSFATGTTLTCVASLYFSWRSQFFPSPAPTAPLQRPRMGSLNKYERLSSK